MLRAPRRPGGRAAPRRARRRLRHRGRATRTTGCAPSGPPRRSSGGWSSSSARRVRARRPPRRDRRHRARHEPRRAAVRRRRRRGLAAGARRPTSASCDWASRCRRCSTPSAPGAPTSTPLAGRERELAALDAAVARVRRAGRVELVTLVGEPGIGKSRLVRELARHAAPDAQVLIGHCPAYGDGVTYWPLREMVLQALRGRTLTSVMAPTHDGRAAAATIAATLGLGGGGLGRRRAVGLPDAAHGARRAHGRSCSPSRTPTGPSRRCSTSSTSSRAGRWRRPSCCCASGAPSCSPRGRRGRRRRRSCARRRWTTRRAAACSAPGRRCPSAALGRGGRAGGRQSALPRAARGPRARAHRGPARSRRPCTRCSRRASTRSARPSAGSSRRARSKGRPSTSAGSRRSSPASDRAGVQDALEALVAARARAARLPVHRRPARVPLRARAGPRRRVRGDAAGGARRRARAAGRDGSRTSAPRCPRPAPGSARSSSAPTRRERAARCPPRGSTRSRTARRRRLAEAAREVHRRGDLPSEIAFLERALALLAPGDGARRRVAAGAWASRCSRPAASTERSRWPTRRVAAGAGSRAPARRGRARAHARLPAPGVGGPRRLARRRRGAAVALEALGDDVGVARARYLMCELAWLQGASERGLREAREALRFARRAGGTVELDAGVSVDRLGTRRQPRAGARRAGRVRRAAAQRGRAPLRRARRARLRRGPGRDGGRLRDGRASSSPGRATGSTTSGCTRPRSGWRCSTPRPSCWPAIRPRAEAALADAERIAREIGDRWFLSTILVDRAHVLLAQDRPRARRRPPSPASRRCPAPSDLEWRIKRLAARGKLAAREGHAEQALERGARGRRAGRRRPSCSSSAPMPGATWPRSRTAWARPRRPRRARATALDLYRAKGNVAAVRQLARFRRRPRLAEPVDSRRAAGA